FQADAGQFADNGEEVVGVELPDDVMPSLEGQLTVDVDVLDDGVGGAQPVEGARAGGAVEDDVVIADRRYQGGVADQAFFFQADAGQLADNGEEVVGVELPDDVMPSLEGQLTGDVDVLDDGVGGAQPVEGARAGGAVEDDVVIADRRYQGGVADQAFFFQ